MAHSSQSGGGGGCSRIGSATGQRVVVFFIMNSSLNQSGQLYLGAIPVAQRGPDGVINAHTLWRSFIIILCDGGTTFGFPRRGDEAGFYFRSEDGRWW